MERIARVRATTLDKSRGEYLDVCNDEVFDLARSEQIRAVLEDTWPYISIGVFLLTADGQEHGVSAQALSHFPDEKVVVILAPLNDIACRLSGDPIDFTLSPGDVLRVPATRRYVLLTAEGSLQSRCLEMRFRTSEWRAQK